MARIKLLDFQKKALDDTANRNRVAYYLDMGLGKTFVGAEKMRRLGAKVNLVICQKSKIDDWIEHFKTHYAFDVFDLTKPDQLEEFIAFAPIAQTVKVGIINYELTFRRPQLAKLKDFTLMLDESSLIQNEKAKRSKFILKMKPTNVILLSGTPVAGKYENLWSQLNLLGWDISKDDYWNTFIKYYIDRDEGFPITYVNGYKNVDLLKRKLREYGAVFMKTEDVIELPDKVFTSINVPVTKEYMVMKKDHLVTLKKENLKLVGDTSLKRFLYLRLLAGCYNPNKINALKELLESTEDRLIIFYNYNVELDVIRDICKKQKRPISYVNGEGKNIRNYQKHDNAVLLIQYGAGAMGGNYQEGSKIIYFSPPLKSDDYEQSQKRVHRIGQTKTCFYYRLIARGSVDERIYATLAMRKDYTDKLFKEDYENGKGKTV